MVDVKPIITDKVKTAINNLTKEPQCTSVWLINAFCNEQQGTSRNENFHHFLNGSQPAFIGVASYHLVTSMLDIAVLVWNEGKPQTCSLLAIQQPITHLMALPLSAVTPYMLTNEGFCIKSEKLLTTEQQQRLSTALIDIANEQLEVTTKNVYYWIAHYVFDESEGINEGTIKKYINSITSNVGTPISNSEVKPTKTSENAHVTEDEDGDEDEDDGDDSSSQEELSIANTKILDKRIIRSNYM